MNLISKILAPLISTTLAMVGAGYLNTKLTLTMDSLGYSTSIISWAYSAYYVGMLLSCKVEQFVYRAGYIKAYTTFAALIAAIILTHSLNTNYYSWILLRFASGFCIGAIFIIVESWFISSDQGNKGKVLALYMIATYGSNAFGQKMVNLNTIEFSTPFVIAALFPILSIIPLTISKKPAPEFEDYKSISLLKLIQIRPSAVATNFAAGAILSVIYTFLPIVIKELYGTEHIANLMFTIIIGGMLAQYPIGYLSDKFDRRIMILLLSLILISCTLLLFFNNLTISLLYIVYFILGAVCFTIYPISINQACDSLTDNFIISVTQALVLIYGLGSVLGPKIAHLFINYFNLPGVYIYFSIINFALVGFLLLRLKIQEAKSPDEQTTFAPVSPGPTVSYNFMQEEEQND